MIDEQRTYSDKLALQNKELTSTTDGKDYYIFPSRLPTILKLNEQLNPDAKKPSNAYGLIPVIYQLDYCIPGPHPGFEEDSRRILAAVTDVIVPESPASLADRDENEIAGAVKGITSLIGVAVGTAIITGTGASVAILGVTLGAAAGPVGMIIGAAVGAIVGWIVGLFASDLDGFAKARIYYASILSALTGVEINPKDPPGEGSGTNDQAANIESK